jgi:asparagine synthase (glutamine-hydrolysing)
MCGIAGILDLTGGPANHMRDRLAAMTGTLAHRGPDADGLWVDSEAGVGFGHRRLSIVDLSSAGAQPMASANGRWIATYNGELYNTSDLRHEVECINPAVYWRGHSDTEVLLEAVALWGVSAAIERCNGMFAIAFWDRRERRLWLTRDRLGIKPLYWTRLPKGGLLFASELRALRSHPSFTARIDPQSVAAYLRSACVPAPRTIYRDTYKLPPGHLMTAEAGKEPSSTCYWDLRDIAAIGQRNIEHRNEDDLAIELETLLLDSVERQMVSDVPLGAFLSGGIDSSIVVALMQARSTRPVRTFTIGFHDKRYNEADHARQIAKHLATDHTELVVEPAVAQATIARLSEIYDEPFADSSQIPTFLVSELARRSVTVALSGDGGDECFGGYVRHHWINRLSSWNRSVPAPLSRTLGDALQMLSPAAWDTIFRPLPARLRPTFLGDKIHKAAPLISLGGTEQIYRRVIAQWPEPSQVMPGIIEAPAIWDDQSTAHDIADPSARVRYFDMAHYLPDDILTKVDRASMAVSLESRVPLLDHRVVEYSWRLPHSALIQGSKGKVLLRRILHKYVPPELVERQKAGFAIPIGDWIRSPLSDWAAGLLSEQSLSLTGLFDVAVIRRIFDEHQRGLRDWQYPLWTILMFQAWYKRWAAT